MGFLEGADMRKTNLASELFLLACGMLPFGILSAFFWVTTGKVPHMLLYALLAIIVGCVIAGIEERFESSRDRKLKEKESDEILHK